MAAEAEYPDGLETKKYFLEPKQTFGTLSESRIFDGQFLQHILQRTTHLCCDSASTLLHSEAVLVWTLRGTPFSLSIRSENVERCPKNLDILDRKDKAGSVFFRYKSRAKMSNGERHVGLMVGVSQSSWQAAVLFESY